MAFLLRTLLAAVAAIALVPAVATADSIVFVKEHDVWSPRPTARASAP